VSTVHPNRIIEDRALNRVTALLQEHGHVVHRIDGRNDFGEDLYVTFAADAKITGDTIAVQVKGGTSYRASGGYRVKVRQHERSWLHTNVPVACVVYDPDTDELYWANASEQLRTAKSAGEEIRSVKVPSDEVLNAGTVDRFVTARSWCSGSAVVTPRRPCCTVTTAGSP
jgi:fructose-1,6-bisphosphatase/inositol monophosphatase family enzyme